MKEPKPVKVINKITKEEYDFHSMGSAARWLGCTYTTVYNLIYGKTKNPFYSVILQ